MTDIDPPALSLLAKLAIVVAIARPTCLRRGERRRAAESREGSRRPHRRRMSRRITTA